MYPSTTTNQEDIQNTQRTAENSHNSTSSQIVERQQIENTPFWLERAGEKWFLIMGQYRLTEGHNSISEVLLHMENNHWYITMNMIAIVVERYEQEKVLSKEIPQG